MFGLKENLAKRKLQDEESLDLLLPKQCINRPNAFFYDKFSKIKNNLKDKWIVLINDISQKRAYEIMEANEIRGIKLHFENNQLKIKKVTSDIIAETLREMFQRNLDNLDSLRNVSCCIGSTCKEPDASLIPKNRNTAGPYSGNKNQKWEFPTLIIEIAYSETKNSLLDSLKMWVSDYTTVNIAIGIKVGKDFKTMNLFMYLRNDERLHTRDLNNFKDGESINIPLEYIYHHGERPASNLADKCFKLDLILFTTKVKEHLPNNILSTKPHSNSLLSTNGLKI